MAGGSLGDGGDEMRWGDGSGRRTRRMSPGRTGIQAGHCTYVIRSYCVPNPDEPAALGPLLWSFAVILSLG